VIHIWHWIQEFWPWSWPQGSWPFPRPWRLDFGVDYNTGMIGRHYQVPEMRRLCLRPLVVINPQLFADTVLIKLKLEDSPVYAV